MLNVFFHFCFASGPVFQEIHPVANYLDVSRTESMPALNGKDAATKMKEG